MPDTKSTATQEPLRWLFTAEFEDGTVIRQTQEDNSKTREGGSAYTDVVEKEKESKLTCFILENVETNEIAFVDLVTGAFSINGTPFNAHDQYFDAVGKDLRLIYHRETITQQNVRSVVQADGSVKQVKEGQPAHFINRYFIGWQTTFNKKNYQATIAVG